jgi:hypothetical protein
MIFIQFYITEEMLSMERMYLIGCMIAIMTAPFVPASILFLLDHIVIRILIVCLLVYVVRFGPTVSIFVVMALAGLFLERNRRKVGEALDKLDAMEVPKFADIHEAYKKTMPVDVPAFDVPVPKEVDFMPHETCDTDAFEPVDVSINQKAVLRSIYPLEGSAGELYEQMGFGHVEGVQ